MAEPNPTPAPPAAPQNAPAAAPAGAPAVPPAAPGAAGDAGEGAITFPNAQAFMERMKREGRKQVEALLTEIGIANLDELKSLVEKGRAPAPAAPAAPAPGNGGGAAGGGAGAPSAADQELTKLRAENEQLKAQLSQGRKRLDAVSLESRLRQEAILAGIVQPAYVEAALALLRAESKAKAGQEVDTLAFFTGLKATNPALFERAPVNPAQTGTHAAPPTPAAPAGAGEPTADAFSKTEAEWRAHKARVGMV